MPAISAARLPGYHSSVAGDFVAMGRLPRIEARVGGPGLRTTAVELQPCDFRIRLRGMTCRGQGFRAPRGYSNALSASHPDKGVGSAPEVLGIHRVQKNPKFLHLFLGCRFPGRWSQVSGLVDYLLSGEYRAARPYG